MATLPEPQPEIESPSRDRTDRCWQDQVIRSVLPRFRILERRGDAEAIWERQGKRIPHRQAFAAARLQRSKANRKEC